MGITTPNRANGEDVDGFSEDTPSLVVVAPAVPEEIVQVLV